MTAVLTLLGIGGVIGGYVTFLLDRKKERESRKLEQKEKRYRSCLLFMDAYFEPNNIKYLESRHNDIHNANDILQYLKAEYHEMLLYASKDVIVSLKRFIENPSRGNFFIAILTMRQDLWVPGNELVPDDVALHSKTQTASTH